MMSKFSSDFKLEAWISDLKKAELWIEGEARGSVGFITSSTQEVKEASPGNANQKGLFFARKGVARDGHDFLNQLKDSENKLLAIVVERKPPNLQTQIPLILVRDTTRAMAIAAKAFYGDPTARALTAAVTGTNGKTTSTFLLQSLFEQMKKPCVRMGTIEVHFKEHSVPASLTTPDFSEIQKIFSELKAKGAEAFVFEASSHALDQRRLLGIELDLALFTNLTQDHLDYHRTMEAYFESKRKLFTELLAKSSKQKPIAVIPEDGAYGSRLIGDLESLSTIELCTWGFEEKKRNRHLFIKKWNTKLNGSELEVSWNTKTFSFKSGLVGKFNIANIAGMLTAGFALGLSSDILQAALDHLPLVSGRLEPIVDPRLKAKVFVDYAHTPDALENVLTTLRPLTSGKLKVVFGCGGDRDKTKRPQMGSVAELYSDEVVVTSDNPRTEDPELIIQEILKGVQRLKPLHIEVDRRKAIELSLQNLVAEDVVLIAGKGHENYQIIGTTKIDFDDREVVQSYLDRKLSP